MKIKALRYIVVLAFGLSMAMLALAVDFKQDKVSVLFVPVVVSHTNYGMKLSGGAVEFRFTGQEMAQALLEYAKRNAATPMDLDPQTFTCGNYRMGWMGGPLTGGPVTFGGEPVEYIYDSVLSPSTNKPIRIMVYPNGR
jgi:hypothetical protein